MRGKEENGYEATNVVWLLVYPSYIYTQSSFVAGTTLLLSPPPSICPFLSDGRRASFFRIFLFLPSPLTACKRQAGRTVGRREWGCWFMGGGGEGGSPLHDGMPPSSFICGIKPLGVKKSWRHGSDIIFLSILSTRLGFVRTCTVHHYVFFIHTW